MHLRLSALLPFSALVFLVACSAEPKPQAFQPPATHGIVWRTLHPFSRDKSDSEPKKSGIQVKVEADSATPSLAATRQIGVRILVENYTKNLATLSFPTSQRIEIIGRSLDGKIFYDYRTDRSFTQEATTLSINPGEHLEYTESVPTKNLVAGKSYLIAASLVGYPGIEGSATITPAP